MDEKDLVKKAKCGDKDAFSRLYINYKDSIYRYAYFKLGSEDDAYDAVSECITQAYLSIATLKNEASFSSWLFRILYRECCLALRRKIERMNTADISGYDFSAPHNGYIAPELEEALAILSEEEKDIVLLSAVAGYNCKEIAYMLNLKHATVRSKLSRALSKMKNFLE